MIVARVITGAGNGINTSTFPVWVSKLAHAKSRGRLVSIEGNLIALGIVIASFFDIGMSFVPGQVQWRLPVAFQLFFIISTAVMAIWLPESPRWLCARGRHHEAIDVLAQIKGRNMPMSNPDVLLLKQTIDDAIALEAKDGPFRFAEVFTSGPLKIRRRFLLAIGLQCMQQISGINVMVYYFPRTLETTTGFQHLTSLYLGAALAITYWVASFIPCIFLDRMFRRWPLIWGAFICGICFMIAGVLQPDPTPVRAKASITFFFIYEFVFGIGWLPIPWLFPSEISPTRYRSHAAALATASDWVRTEAKTSLTCRYSISLSSKLRPSVFLISAGKLIVCKHVSLLTSSRLFCAQYGHNGSCLFVLPRHNRIDSGTSGLYLQAVRR